MSHALSKVKAAGYSLELDGGDLVIEPFSKLTQTQLMFLKTHKAEIIDELKQQQAPEKFLHWRIVRKGRIETIHITPPHTLDEMRHIYRGADLVEPVESF
jgi:hypothetical protein